MIAPRGLAALGFAEPGEDEHAFEDVHHRYPADESLYDNDTIAALANGQPPDGDTNDVDRQFLDPLFNRADGNTADPQTLGHSGYFEDPYFPGCVGTVIQLARQRRTNLP